MDTPENYKIMREEWERDKMVEQKCDDCGTTEGVEIYNFHDDGDVADDVYLCLDCFRKTKEEYDDGGYE